MLKRYKMGGITMTRRYEQSDVLKCSMDEAKEGEYVKWEDVKNLFAVVENINKRREKLKELGKL